MNKSKQYLKTPASHLAPGYPLPSDKDSKRYGPIWTLAFQIHRLRHDFRLERDRSPDICNPCLERNLVKRKKSPYCDCYEHAYRLVGKQVLANAASNSIPQDTD